VKDASVCEAKQKKGQFIVYLGLISVTRNLGLCFPQKQKYLFISHTEFCYTHKYPVKHTTCHLN